MLLTALVFCGKNDSQQSNSSAAQGKAGYVTVSKLFVRSEANAKSEKLGEVFLGEKVIVLETTKATETINGKTGNWLKIDFKGKTGYLFGGFIADNPVASADEMAKKLSGTYYYRSKDDTEMIRMLILKNMGYEEYYYNFNSGITDLYTGKVGYQADSVELFPESRKARPSIYIDNPQTKEEETAYQNAYIPYSQDSVHLVTLKRLPVDEGKVKYYLMNCSGKEMMLPENFNCTNYEYAYKKIQ
ncbi:MAG: hypothetical protein A2Y41_09520 [Spirochaetes bacterium GWB1_36_13]|nr:MAG: hypothetical protein A2Y41_09520 [Spirochaetes bacterium GWB1_36_13]